MTRPDERGRISEIRERLVEIESEQRSLNEELVILERAAPNTLRVAPRLPTSAATPLITKHSSPADKIWLFRRRFAGRGDVFPLRWENTSAGKTGYAPACFNEWKPGVCNKPRVKCGDCPHQAFVPVSDDVIRQHLGR